MSVDELLYLSAADVAAVGVTMPEIIRALERAFAEKGKGGVEMPPKPGIHPRTDSFIHAMPAYVPSLDAAGLKWVAGYPANRARGLPYVSGLLILNDAETGLPIAVMDATWITAMRTGAATAVAAKYLARADSQSAGILACGVQGRSNLEALAAVFALGSVRAYDSDPDAAARFAAEMSGRLGVKVEVVPHPRDAVDGPDLVVTSGPILKHPTPVIGAGWLRPGAFACALDFDSYWQAEALREVERLTADDVRQLDYYRAAGYFRETPEPYADLGELVAGTKSGRESDEERALCLNLGLALEDVVVAALVIERGLEKGIGRRLPL